MLSCKKSLFRVFFPRINTQKIILIFVLTAMTAENTFADIIIRADSTPFNLFAAWLATHPDDQSWLKYVERQHPNKETSAKLENEVELAQKTYLNGSLDEALKQFKNIADKALEDDWNKSQRKVITYAMLRVAQLDKSKAHQTYVKKAAEFGVDVVFSTDLFPPPLMAEFHEQIHHLKSHMTKIVLSQDFSGFEVLKIDGHSYSLSQVDSIKLGPGAHRISLLASHAQYFSEKLTAGQLQAMNIHPVAVLTGNCSDPGVNVSAGLPFQGLFDGGCLRTFNGKSWDHNENTIKLDSLTSQQDQSQLKFPTEPVEPSSKISKRTWIWIGIGAAVLTSAALIYKNNMDRNSGGSDSLNPTNSASAPTVIPTHRQGN